MTTTTTGKTPNTTSTSTQQSTNLFSYLLSLPPRVLLNLYSDNTNNTNTTNIAGRGIYACRAALQHLPPIARQYVLRLASCGGTLELEHCLKWCNAQYGNKHYSVVEAMERLCVIFCKEKDSNKEDKKVKVLQLTPQFLVGIQKSISSLQSAPWPAVDVQRLYSKTTLTLPNKTSKATATSTKTFTKLKLTVTSSSSSKVNKDLEKPPTANDLEIYTQRRWDSVLHYLVGSTGLVMTSRTLNIRIYQLIHEKILYRSFVSYFSINVGDIVYSGLMTSRTLIIGIMLINSIFKIIFIQKHMSLI